jgi:hypothetical protein
MAHRPGFRYPYAWAVGASVRVLGGKPAKVTARMRLELPDGTWHNIYLVDNGHWDAYFEDELGLGHLNWPPPPWPV